MLNSIPYNLRYNKANFVFVGNNSTSRSRPMFLFLEYSLDLLPINKYIGLDQVSIRIKGMNEKLWGWILGLVVDYAHHEKYIHNFIGKFPSWKRKKKSVMKYKEIFFVLK